MKRILAAFACCISFAIAREASAFCAYAQPGSLTTQFVGLVNFAIRNAGDLSGGMSMWSEGCSGMGETIPELSSTTTGFIQGPGVVNVNVFFPAGTSADGRCGNSTMYYSDDGQLTGGNIFIYQYQVVNGQQTLCSSLPNYNAMIAHEIGHALGLYDTYLVDPNACRGAIMSADPEFVVSDECTLADASFYTVTEEVRDNQLNELCSASCWTSCQNGTCPSSNGECGGCLSPILVDLDQNGFHLGSAADPVAFDLTADGNLDLVTWTRAGQHDAFLCRDLNHNGRIDNGAELFGNYTRLASGALAPNGYEALKELDVDGDGFVDGRDPGWAGLRLWIDANHDGISQPVELTSLDAARVVRISTRYVRENRNDAYGNVFRFKGTAWVRSSNGGEHPVQTYDVFFSDLPQ